MKEIYQQTAEEVLERVESRESGLTDEQVRRSREKCGWNELAEGKKKSILQIFFEQYKDFLVLILIASAVISGMLGDVESAAVIVIVITINAILGTVQTVKAEQSLQSLKKLSGPEAKVLRDGVAVQLPARELVVGDVILLEAGDMIPADGRLIENASLKVDESALTGESLAVEKSMDTILEEAPLGDRTNMLFSGSFVTSLPSITIFPSSTGHTPAIAFRVVDFPAPFPPMIVTKSPSFKVRFKSFKACFSFTVPLLNVLFT